MCAVLLLTPVGAMASVHERPSTQLPHLARQVPAAQEVPAGVSGQDFVPMDRPDGTFAVLPFINISRDEADDWLGDGFAETVAADLAASPGVSVVGRDQVESTLTEGPGEVLDASAATRLGRSVGANWVVTGGFQRVGERLRVTVRLLDAGTGSVTDSVTADGTMDEVFDLQDQIVAGLLRERTSASNLTGPERRARTEADPLPTSEGSGLGNAPAREREAVGGAGRAARAPRAPERGPGSPVPGGLVIPRAEPAGRAASGRADGGGLGGPVAAAVSAGALAGRPSVNASFAAEPPTVDGTLDDAIWRSAARLTEFVQVAPVEGDPATEDTEVFVAFDSTHLYLGMHAHYSNPGMVRASRVDRDRASYSDDTISIYFDTFLDQQRAFVFTLNGYGVQGDSLMGGSRGGGFRGGGGGGGVPRGDRSWDALFESGGVLVDDGWTAELAIPFKSLRYPSNDTHRWGFQVARSIRGKDETVVWAPVSRDVSGFLPQMGLLDGLRNLSTSRNLEILPTMTAIQVGSLDTTTGAFPGERQPEAGVNLKYGLTSNLTLDFTYNPDFSQIESDRPQIEVNQRFPLFFSELRPFFLEGQEIFNLQGPVTFVHTRTIVDPRYGAKVTGKVGKATLGLLFANDEAAGKLDDPSERGFGQSANTVIARARYDLYSQSHIGAVFTDREFLGSYSRLTGVDSRLQVTPTASIDFAALTTQNRGVDGLDTTGSMFDGGYRHSGRNLSYNVSAYQIDPDFDTEVGFIRRRDIRRISSSAGYRWWPESWLINWGPEFQYSRNWDFDDVLEDEEARLRLRMSFAKNLSFNGDIRREMERFGGINFDKNRYSLGGNVNTSRLLSFGGSYNWGDQVRFSGTPFLGNGSSGRVFTSMRPHPRLQSFFQMNTSRLIDPFDESEVFDVKIFRAQTTYQFTDRLLLRNILEHNTFSGTLGANLLLTYRVNSGTVFFVGYDDRYQQGDLIFDDDDEPLYFTTDFERTNRAFFTKISYLFRY